MVKTIILLLVVLAIFSGNHFVHSQGCDPRYFDQESFVCVCSAAYCDFIGTIDTPGSGSFRRVVSSSEQFRFEVFDGTEDTFATGTTIIHINHDYEYQTMLGFGGAFTDATGINVVALSDAAQDNFMRSYFAPEGIEYSVGRIPIAGSDFSTRPYSYDDNHDGDVDLQFFALEPEDYNYKIPLIQKAIALSAKQYYLFGSPWAPPPWMKENGQANGQGGLLREMWDPYSNYLVKFVQAYENEGIPIWGITPQNEPLTGFSDWAWNTCAFSNDDMRDWIKTSFGPIMTEAGLRRVKVMVLDHNRDALPWYPATSLEDPQANQYIDGVAVHWYDDSNSSPNLLTETHELFPDKFLLYTEACEGWYDGRVLMGSWQRAENIAANILEDVNHFSTGWVDWNMALDMGGGPNWANNFVDSPVIVDAGADEFYKQPMFYVMGHFSKFVQDGATRVYSGVEGDYGSVFSAVFHNPDGSEAVIVLNKADYAIPVSIESHAGNYINVELNPNSIETILFPAD